MNAQITKHDVMLYFAEQLDIDRRREIEAAWSTNERVKGWFADLAPTSDELEREPAPALGVDPRAPAFRRLAVETYLSTEQEATMHFLAEWFRTVAASANRIADFAREFAADTLVQFGNGSLILRDAVPMTLRADRTFPVMRKLAPPAVQPDYATGRLTIAQWAKDVPSGVVDVFAAKRIEPGRVQVSGPVRVQMYGGTHKNMKYYYADISLRSLVGDFKPGDEFFYYVEPAADEGGADATDCSA